MNTVEEAPDVRRRMSLLAGATWTLLVIFVIGLALGLTEEARPGASTDVVNLTSVSLLAFAIAMFAILRVYAPQGSVRDVFGVRHISLQAYVLAVGLGLGLHPALSRLDDLVLRRFPQTAEALEAAARISRAETVGRRVVLAIAMAIVFPVAEELFFRGALFGTMKRGRAARSVVLAGALYFAAFSGDPRYFPTLLLFGGVLGWLRSRSGSVVPTALAHVAFATVPVIPILAGRDPMADVRYAPSILVGGLVMAAAAAFGLHLLTSSDEDVALYRELDG